RVNGMIHVDLPERLQFQDTNLNTEKIIHASLDEALKLQESDFDAKRQFEIELDEMLNIKEASHVISINGQTIINLIEEITFADSAVGLQNIKSNQILVDPLKHSYTLDQDNLQLVFTQCDVALRSVFIKDGAQNTMLNYSQILKKVGNKNMIEICNALRVYGDIVGNNDITEAIIDFGDSTIITGSSIYNGNIILPTLTPTIIPTETETTVTTKGSTIITTTTTTTYDQTFVIKVGQELESLTFNKPVRIVFPVTGDEELIGFFENPVDDKITFIKTRCDENILSSDNSKLNPNEECFIQFGKGFWKNHPEQVAAIMKLGPIYLGDTTVETVEQAISILKNASAKDAKDSLRSHLLTTILNLRAGAIPDNNTNNIINQAISFLATHPNPISGGDPDRKEALDLKGILEEFNEQNFFLILTTHFTNFGTSRASKSTSTTTTTTGGGSGEGGSGGSSGGGGGGGGSTTTPSTPSTPTPGVGFPGTLGPITTGFGDAKFSNLRSGGGCFVDSNQSFTVSGIIDSSSPLNRVEIRFVHEGNPFESYTSILMDVTSVPNEKTSYYVLGTIPWEFMSGSNGIRYWIYVIDESSDVSESDKYLMNVKPGYSLLENDLEVLTIQAEGTTLNTLVYIDNSISEKAFGTISLIVDGKVVDTIEQNFAYGESLVSFAWDIPRTGKVVDYQIKAIAQFCEKQFGTEEITLSTFPRVIVETIPGLIDIESFIDKFGNTIASAFSLHAFDKNSNSSFRIIAPDGTCVIGIADHCLINDATFGGERNMQSITIDNQIYRIRYSGPDNILERFTITSIDPIVGKWGIFKESPDGKTLPQDVGLVKIHYAAQESRTPRDSDGDGLSDFDEVNTYNTDPFKADTDNDGLTDGLEIELGTDPFNRDTDNGGVDDGIEVLIDRTNPLIGSDDLVDKQTCDFFCFYWILLVLIVGSIVTIIYRKYFKKEEEIFFEQII
ncbi:MAG: hypothetical protein ACE5RN_07530, partial [Nitrosopumilaceae archaeon]